jgi:hypothetical protein
VLKQVQHDQIEPTLGYSWVFLPPRHCEVRSNLYATGSKATDTNGLMTNEPKLGYSWVFQRAFLLRKSLKIQALYFIQSYEILPGLPH